MKKHRLKNTSPRAGSTTAQLLVFFVLVAGTLIGWWYLVRRYTGTAPPSNEHVAEKNTSSRTDRKKADTGADEENEEETGKKAATKAVTEEKKKEKQKKKKTAKKEKEEAESRKKKDNPPEVLPEKRDYKFQDHMSGPYPFDYEPPVEPARLVEMMKEKIDLGTYRMDRKQPVVAEKRTPAEDEEYAPDLSDLRWHPKKRSYPKLLRALADELPEALTSPGVPREVFDLAWKISVSEDGRAAAGFAEVKLRLARPKDVPEAFEKGAAAYWLTKEFDRLDALLEAGAGYRPTDANSMGWPEEVEEILREAMPDTPSAAEKCLFAVITGDAERASMLLPRIEAAEQRKNLKPLVQRLKNGLAAGGATGDGDGDLTRKIKQAVTGVQQQLEDMRLPLEKRFEDGPIERLEDHLKWVTDVFGGYSDPAADLLAYMLEKRDYDRLQVHSGTALNAAKRMIHRLEAPRALPMFLLCQKLGYLSEEGRFDEDGPNAMVSFNGFESSLYFAKTVGGHPGLMEYLQKNEDVYRVGMKMLEYSEKHCLDPNSAGIAGRSGYYELLLKARWQLGLVTDHAGDVVPGMKRAIEKNPSASIRRKAVGMLGVHYMNMKKYDRAADLFRRLALGKIDGNYNGFGVSMLHSVVQESGSKAIRREFLETAKTLIEKGEKTGFTEDSMENVKRRYRQVLDKSKSKEGEG